MQEYSAKWEEKVGKFYKVDKPYYLESIEEIYDKSHKSIKRIVVNSRENIPESDINDLTNDFILPFYETINTEVYSNEEDIKDVRKKIKGIGIRQGQLEETLEDARTHHMGIETRPNYILNKLVNMRRTRRRNEQ